MKNVFWTVLALAVLPGCTRAVDLRATTGDVIGKAYLELVGQNDGNVQLAIQDELYRGRWFVRNVDESGRIAGRYGLGSRQYQNYTLGRTEHLKQGEAHLTSSRGDELICTFTYRGAVARGDCVSDQHQFEFVTEEQAG